jgi:hypothetical protein
LIPRHGDFPVGFARADKYPFMKKVQAELVSGLDFFTLGKDDSILSVTAVVAVLFVTSTILGRECHSAKYFSRLRRTNGLEMAESFSLWQSGGF